MTGSNSRERTIAAPEDLGLDTRAEFRRRAVSLLEEMPEGEGRLVVDLGKTGRIDSSGLGVLMLVQRRAAERRQTVALRRATDEVRFLLTLTKLIDLFELETA
jgi:ABC-type transporter Mla MlaB component